MAHQAEAERDRRAKVINAEGEFQAADKLRRAAEIMTPYPMAMQMRYLQTLTEVASERNSTIIFPLPLELLRPFLGSVQANSHADSSQNMTPEVHVAEAKVPAPTATTNGLEPTPVMSR